MLVLAASSRSPGGRRRCSRATRSVPTRTARRRRAPRSTGSSSPSTRRAWPMSAGSRSREVGGEPSTSASASSRTAPQFPPGHLAEHQATAAPVRVWYRMRGDERYALRLEDAALVAVTRRPAHSTAATAASSSSSLKISISDDGHDAVAVDDEDPRLARAGATRRSRRRREVGRRRRRSGPAGAGRRRLQLIRLDVDERHIRDAAAAIGLTRSSVGPHCAVLQNFGVAKTTHERLLRGQRVGDRTSRRTPSTGCVSVEILATSPPTSARVGVSDGRRRVADARPTVDSGWTSNADADRLRRARRRPRS